MSKVLVTDTHLSDIADAIREKLGVTTTYRPGDMAAAIESISGGPEPTGTISITQNGVFNIGQYATADVYVTPNLQAKTVTENGTVTADSGYDGLSSVTVNVPASGSAWVERWDLTKSNVGEIHGMYLIYQGTLTQKSNGLQFGSDGYVMMSCGWPGMAIELDVAAMQLDSNVHIFVEATNCQLAYTPNNGWGFQNNYSGSTVYASEMSASFFKNSTVKIVIDKNRYWHIYKNNVLWWEPSVRNNTSDCRVVSIGDQSGYGIEGAIISGIRIGDMT